ncbi:nitroreductase family protein [Cucumibacter marinus]|uniref:nitroreductase family protein n=1 Tax=Cucumibacter marinus TaxID=1121252 RepID=UPI000419F54D|nr:SagB/ThcOx family dehydrogenase [Cucumibacter marinus]
MTGDALDQNSLIAAFKARRTIRKYAGEPVERTALDQLLWAAQGVTGPNGERTAPSAHALHPLAVRVAAQRVSGLETGLYSWSPDTEGLALLRSGSMASDIEAAAIGDQPWLGSAAAIVCLSGDTARMDEAFAAQTPAGDHGARFLAMEAGAATQNMQLMATSIGLASVPVAGFHDNTLKTVLDLPDTETPLLLFALGYPAS